METDHKTDHPSLKNIHYDATGVKKYLEETLGNFIYRYIQPSGEPPVAVLALSNNIWVGRGIERNLKLALNCQDETARTGLTELIRSRTRLESKPSVLWEIRVEIEKLDSQGKGVVKATTTINWDYPDHFETTELKSSRVSVLKFEETGVLRKQFPLILEEVCQIF